MDLMDAKVIVLDRLGVTKRGELVNPRIEQITWDLYGPGSASIIMDPLESSSTLVTLEDSEIQIWLDDVLRWQGIPVRAEGSNEQVTFQCEDLTYLLSKRFVDRTSLLYTSIDQLSIAWNLVAYAQDESLQANRDLNIDAAVFGASGVTRSRDYRREEHANLLELLREFYSVNLDNGFDWEIVTDGSGSRLWTPYYPQKGSLRSQHRIEFTENQNSRNVQSFTFTNDAVTVATHVYVTGGSEGEVKFEENYEDAAASLQYGVRQDVISEGSQKDVAWLDARAQREVEARKAPLTEFSIQTVQGVPTEFFGNVWHGDSVPTLFNYGWIQFEGNLRIQALTLTDLSRLDLRFVKEQ